MDGMGVFAVGATVIELRDYFTSTIFDNKEAYKARRARRASIVPNFPRPSTRANYLIGWAIVISASLGTAGIQHQRVARMSIAKQPPPVSRVVARIASKPSGAEVFIDGVSTGATPLVTEMTPGVRNIQLKLKGFANVQTTVVLQSSSDEAMNFDLVPDEGNAAITEPRHSRKKTKSEAR